MKRDALVIAAGLLGWIGFLLVAWLRFRGKGRTRRDIEAERERYPIRMSFHHALRKYRCPPPELDERAKLDGWTPLRHNPGYGKKGTRRVAR